MVAESFITRLRALHTFTPAQMRHARYAIRWNGEVFVAKSYEISHDQIAARVGLCLSQAFERGYWGHDVGATRVEVRECIRSVRTRL